MAAVRSRASVPPAEKQRHHREAVKKASYYVWFLGAKECRGLSGDEYVHPAVRQLVEKENNVEPLKVTLQVSSKGMKIVHNGNSPAAVKGGSKGGKEEQGSKHFIPDNNICYVTQEMTPNDDIVACIVLIPVTKCPLHVHVYRCDSVETATVLRHHLQSLVERPENQKKVAELEQQRRLLQPKRERPPQVMHPRQVTVPPVNPEEQNSTGGSSSSDRENYMLDERVSILHESLTAELREKLNNRKNDGPLLLPPKDYDKTLRRMREAEKRPGLVAVTSPASRNNSRRNTERDSSGKSSGIGSDEAPSSPTHERGTGAPFTPSNAIPTHPNRHSQHHDYSSEEDECWNVDEERLVAAVKKPTFPDVRRSSSPQPLVVSMDPSNDLKGSKTKAGIWPPPLVLSSHRGGRVPLSPSKSYDDQPLARHNGVRRNESLGAREVRYHELPRDMRYPGLDRETAAPLPFTSPAESSGVKKTLTPTSPVREYDWDRQLRHYAPAERSPSTEDISYRYPQHPSIKRSSRLPVATNSEDERRFYRYSSPDMEAVTNTNYRY